MMQRILVLYQKSSVPEKNSFQVTFFLKYEIQETFLPKEFKIYSAICKSKNEYQVVTVYLPAS